MPTVSLRRNILIAALLCASLGFVPSSRADDAPATGDLKTSVSKLAVKTVFASGLKEPQGMAFNARGNVLICDYGAGQVLEYSRDGRRLGVLAEDLQSPSQIVMQAGRIYVSERKANRIIEVKPDGKIVPVGQPIIEPMGLVSDGSTLFAVAHTTSKIYRYDGAQWHLIFEASIPEGRARRYGYRCLGYDRGTLLLSDEVGKEVLLMSQSGRMAKWATGIADPSGIAIAPDGAAYVTDESEGGRLIAIGATGEKEIVAQGLGRPRGILFLDKDNALVADRDGTVWKLTGQH
jgi:sugar lactone lactonase YvrE